MTLQNSENLGLYNNRNVFNEMRIPLANILSISGTLEESLELGEGKNRFSPLGISQNFDGLVMKNTRCLYHDDPHYNEISGYFDSIGESPFFYNWESIRRPLGYSHILNLANSPKDIRFRQKGVSELVQNHELFQAVEQIFSELEVYHPYGIGSRDEVDYNATLDPKKAKKLLEQVSELSAHSPTSEAFKKLQTWCEEVSNHSYFQHILQEHYKVNDPHVLSFYSQRFEKRVFATLKPGVDIEDFCDIIPESGVSYTDTIGRGKHQKVIERRVIYAESRYDDTKDEIPFARVRERVDHIKKMASASLSIPLFLLLAQLKHLYLGALMYKDLEKKGFPICFPEISDNSFELEFKELYPLGGVFQNQDREGLMPNDLSLTEEEKIVYIKGPNKCGKSELFRSIHIMNMLINAGFPIPAQYVKSGIVPSSKFILFQGNRHSGSQLENAKNHVFRELGDVLQKSNVVLDEVGDATNEPTAKEMGERFIAPLLDHECRLYVTSHHDALDGVVERFGGVSLTPLPGAEGKERFKIVRSDDTKIDYNAGPTLDRIGITRKSVSGILPSDNRTHPKRRKPSETGPHHTYEDDIPF